MDNDKFMNKYMFAIHENGMHKNGIGRVEKNVIDRDPFLKEETKCVKACDV